MSGPLVCPGCGGLYVHQRDLPAPLFHSSPECFAAYGELAAWSLAEGLQDPAFVHQHVVDTYQAQHIGPDAKPILAAYSLLGLCLALEHGYSGRQVQLAHMQLASPKRDWPSLKPQTQNFAMTVPKVLIAQAGPARYEAIRAWMQATWAAWGHEQGRVRGWIEAEIIGK